MEFLLGDKDCMESLQTDVQDLHWAVMEVISRTGPLSYPSWKYPHTKAGEVNIESLLETYTYSDDKEECQVSNIILYELVIDRLMILLQAMASFTESLFAGFKENEVSTAATSCTLGLVAKRYWSRLTHLHSTVQQVQSENKSMKKKVADLERSVTKLKEDAASSAPSSAALTTPGLMGLIPPNNADLALMQSGKKFSIAQDNCNKGAQTQESAFVPCESCHFVQDSLRQAGDTVVRACDKHGLPSSLKKFKAQVANLKWMTPHDVMRWSAEQSKDVSRISHYLERLTGDVEPMKQQVEAFEKELKSCETRTRQAETSLQEEKEITQTVRRQAETRLREREAALGEDLNAALRERDSLVSMRRDLELELERQRKQLSDQTQKLSSMEEAKEGLQKELEASRKQVERLEGTEGEAAQLRTQMEEVTRQLDSASQALAKEQARYRSATKQNESLQAKQVSLLERIGAMDQEGEELKEQVAELEEEKEQLAQSLATVQQEVKDLQLKATAAKDEVDRLKKEKSDLELEAADTQRRVEELEKLVDEARERERLLIEYPDLNGPVNPDYQGTGDIAIDMENQVAANNVRIQVLEEQNAGLQNSIAKVLSMQGRHSNPPAPPQPSSLMTGGPQQLWNAASLQMAKQPNDTCHHDNRMYNKNNNSSKPREAWSEIGTAHIVAPTPPPPKSSHSQTRPPSGPSAEFLVGRSTRPDSASRHRRDKTSSRPPSGKTFQPVNNSSISAYKDLKKRGLIRSIPNDPRNYSRDQDVHVPGSADDQQHTLENFTCDRCDKMFSRARDLEIHYSYCTR